MRKILLTLPILLITAIGYCAHSVDNSGNNVLINSSGTGNVGIGSTVVTQKLYVNGNIHATGDVTCGGTCGSGSSSALEQINKTIENPQDSDSFILFKASAGFTITDIHCIVDPADSSESVVIDVQECDSTADNCVTVDATITCDNDGAEDDGTLSNGAIDSGDWVKLDIGTVTGTVSQLIYSIYY